MRCQHKTQANFHRLDETQKEGNRKGAKMRTSQQISSAINAHNIVRISTQKACNNDIIFAALKAEVANRIGETNR